MMIHTPILIAITLLASSLSTATAEPVPIPSVPQAPKAGQKVFLSDPIAQIESGPTLDATSEAAEPKGRLEIRVIQGTPDGPGIGAAEVQIDLLHQSKVLKTINARLDDQGMVVLDDLSIGLGIQPVVRIEHRGVSYHEAGTIMDLANPTQKIELVCYEVTDETPSWTIPIRQVMLSFTPKGIRVTEIIVVKNPADQTWLGIPSPSGHPITTTFVIPQDAQELELGSGFRGWDMATHEKGALVSHQPLLPSMTELDFSYVLIPEDGLLKFDIVAPSSVDQMLVIMPEDITVEKSAGVDLGGSRKIADTQVNYYTAAGLMKGDTVSFELRGISGTAGNAAIPGASSTSSKRLVAVIGALAILVAVIYLILRSSSAVSDR